MLQLSQGSKLGLGRGYERTPSGGKLVLWSVVVFDRAAVIAPRRPRRVSTIKTSTSKRDSFPKDRRAWREEGDLRRAGKSIYSFCVNNFYICGKIDSDVSLKVPLGALPPLTTACFSLSASLLGPRSNLFYFQLCIEKHERSGAEAGRPPGAGAEAFSRSSLHVAPSSKAAPIFSPGKERSV